jgi:hypothetical protein
MKHNYRRNLMTTQLLALALAAGSAVAGEPVTTAPVTPAPAEDVISGVLKLDFNSHFISYGNDVWLDGSSMSDPTFNPMLEIAIELPAGFTASLGTWWDVNSKNGGDSSPLGGRIQEVDVWAGLAYTVGDFTTKVTYQNWMYSGGTEDILDIAFSYDTFLSPSITVHNRLDTGGVAGSGGQAGDEGTVVVGGLSYGFDAGPFSISIPFNIAYFATDEFHAPGADDGLGYGSLGVAASIPISFIGSEYGEWTLNGNLTYYITDSDVIPNNPQSDFLTAGVGIGIAF